MNNNLATMFVFAGNNGSGKSTIRNLIIDKLGVSVNIDPDALARGIDREKLIIDNSGAGGEIVMEADSTQSKQYTPELPECVETIERALEARNSAGD